MKKSIAFLLSLLMLLSLTAPALAAEGGDDASQGYAYLWGDGVQQDYGKARELLRKAADTGNTEVYYTLGEIYEYGLGVKKDLIEAVRWYLKAAKNGVREAEDKLKNEPLKSIAESMGVQKQETHAMDYFRGENGVEQDYAMAFKLFLKEALAGDALAEYYLGWMLETGTGVDQDLEEAAKHYSAAANAGVEEAKDKLATEPFESINKELQKKAEPEEKKTATETDKSAEKEDGKEQDAKEMFEEGQRYENGDGVKKNLVKATKWFLKAADAGSEEAKRKLETEPFKTIASALSTQKQATHAEGSYGEREQIFGYYSPFYLDKPLIKIKNMTVVIYYDDYVGGWPYADWGVYVRGTDGVWRYSTKVTIGRELQVGDAMSAHVTMENGDVVTALALCPLEYGLDFTVHFDIYYIVSEENIGEYDSTLHRPAFVEETAEKVYSSVHYEPPQPAPVRDPVLIQDIIFGDAQIDRGEIPQNYGTGMKYDQYSGLPIG